MLRLQEAPGARWGRLTCTGAPRGWIHVLHQPDMLVGVLPPPGSWDYCGYTIANLNLNLSLWYGK